VVAEHKIDVERASIFADVLRLLNRERVPYVVAGAFAVGYYTGLWRDTKDMDLFLVREDAERGMRILSTIGFTCWIEAEHWLGKCTRGDTMVDLIYGYGNWFRSIDRAWIDRAQPSELFGVRVLFAPLEEMILSKSFVAHRERFDGADIVHLIRASRGKMDWDHLVRRYGEYQDLLLPYLLLFRFIYPSEGWVIPDRIMMKLIERVKEQMNEPTSIERVCRGPLLDRYQFVYDIDDLGYHDPREELAVAQGGTREQVVLDRQIARRMLENGRVRPREEW